MELDVVLVARESRVVVGGQNCYFWYNFIKMALVNILGIPQNVEWLNIQK